MSTTERTYTALFPFGGIGGGALGFAQAHAELLGCRARFEVIGGIDFDAGACADFEYLTEKPSLEADIASMTPDELRAFAGPKAPDVVFASPPCKGASGLLSNAKAKTEKYRAMNRLALKWIDLMLATWEVPPKLVLIENVPRIKKRAGAMLRELRKKLRKAGYVFSDGFHDCGEIGGLAQHRNRYLLVARHQERVPTLLYHPPTLRVRGVGEVLESLPMPGDPAGGPMHELPKLSWLNWVRLALIPAGGDWRDLPGTLEEGQARREEHRRHHVAKWADPCVTIAGSGSNGPVAVADPRWILKACKPGAHHNKYRVEQWDSPAHTVIGASRVGSGAMSVADPRVQLCHSPRSGAFQVIAWDAPSPTVRGVSTVRNGPCAAADPRVNRAFDHGYRVVRWDEPSFTVAGGSHPGQGAYSVADPRVKSAPRAGAYGVIHWTDAAKTVTGSANVDNGSWAVADPRGQLVIRIPDVTKAPQGGIPVIVSEDGTWHRPFTTLELAVLQGFPFLVRGEPLALSGKSKSAHRERIGNAVPPPAARSIATRMLIALVQADAETFCLDGNLNVWVRRDDATEGAPLH